MSLNSNPVMNNVRTGIRNLDYEYDMPMLHGDRFNYLSIISLDNKGIFYMLKLSPTKIIRVERQGAGGQTQKYLPVY